MALICSTFKLHPHWWEADGIEPPAPKGPRLQRSDGTSLSLTALPDRFIYFGCRDRSRTDLEQLMRLPGSRTSLQRKRGFSSPSHTAGTSAVCRISFVLHPNWRKREVLIPNGKAIHLASNERRTPVRLRFLNIWRKAERTMLIRVKARTIRIPSDADAPVG